MQLEIRATIRCLVPLTTRRLPVLEVVRVRAQVTLLGQGVIILRHATLGLILEQERVCAHVLLAPKQEVREHRRDGELPLGG